MARSLPTEDSLGLSPTDDELATGSAPLGNDDDDISHDDEPTPVVEAAPVVVKGDDKPADTPDPAADPAAKPEEPKTVDIRALQEARASERELRQQNAVLLQRANDMLAMINRPPEPVQQQEQPKERPTGDPLALLEYLAEKVDRQELSAAQAREMAQQEGYRQQALNQIHNLELEFKATAPDYDDAINHLRETRHRELEIMFPLSNAQQRNEYIAQEWQQIVNESARAGLNPAQQVYNLAKARGFTAPQAAALAATQQRQPDLQAVAAAQQRHQSLSDAPGGETIAPLDAKALARMSDKDFKAWMSKKGNDAKFDEIMGR